ncbi:hypothetical protein ABZV87_11975 [Streptomyces tendae]|uniref:P-loop NTPase n=1 Tax=Streptomyces tendae TaxID=1932 RepID=UPI0033AA63A8
MRQLSDAQRRAAEEALELWFPKANRRFVAMPQGRSGTGVVGVDLAGDTAELTPGRYVLRVGPSDDGSAQANETAAHQMLRDADPNFATAHLPHLLKIGTAGEGADRLVVTLYEVAGGGLLQYVAPRTRSTGLRLTARRLSKDLLTAWADPRDMRLTTPYGLLSDIAGPDRAVACMAAAEALFPGNTTLVRRGGHTFFDPREVLSPARPEQTYVMYGQCHGDLNTGNLLVPVDERAGSDEGYWIVDTIRARSGPAGFDLAYLEVSVLVNILPDMAQNVLARCLDIAEGVVARPAPDDMDWLVTFLQESRDGVREWMSRQPGRVDQLACQFLLVRLIAGVLWARRFAPDSTQARLCLAYAGWYAMRYAAAVGLDDTPPGRDPDDEPGEREQSAAADELWQSMWDEASGFAVPAARYVLVADRMPTVDSVAALGRIPWSLVIDLDPRSDGEGLLKEAGPVLEGRRAVHRFTRDQPLVDFARGAAWMLAVGSVLRNEPPDDLRTWRYRRLAAVRQVAHTFREAAGDTPVVVVVLQGLPGEGGEQDRLPKVIDALDEVFQGDASFLHIGTSAIATSAELTWVPLPLPAFLTRLGDTLDTTATQGDYTVPALDHGSAAISPDSMQKLREHLVVLHDGIELTVSPNGGRQNDEFWRGGLISWADLDFGRDVPRSVAESLMVTLRESLQQHRNRTVLLHHKPGTGGTTVALRAAWDLHHEYPVAVLPHGSPVDRTRVPLIADRVHLLHTWTQAPVLLVAESADLSESDREALYQELAKRGARVILLYVRRGLGDAPQGMLAVGEVLDPTEAKEFERRYSELVVEQSRIGELRRLSRGDQYEQYRTPFFYGLVTFERQFTKLTDYVSTHLEKVRGRAREVMLYLALVTVFTNTGLQRESVLKLMRQASGTTDLDLGDVLGPEAARLVAIRSGRVRLQHQLISEEVLSRLLDDTNWRYHVKDLAIDFIEALAHYTDVSTEPVRMLLRQMFLDRQGGTMEGVEDRGNFAPLIEELDENSAHAVLKSLTQHVPGEPHFWTHLGRHQLYRLDREYDKAESYVQRAVALAEHDFIHHHALGLTRRAILRQQLTVAKRRGAAAVMRAIEEHYERTVECFEISRRLNRENLHGYITHVQTITHAARTLKEAARVGSIAMLDGAVGDWVKGKVSEATALLHEATQTYRTLDDQDSYFVRCRTDIEKLHGHWDEAVELWEVAATRRATPMVQRSLAQAYYLRAGRRWTALDVPELRRVEDLARRNLSRRDCREEDYRLWFEAYKLLPEFDIDEALSQLERWSDRFPSWRAHYYRYCLLFHLWFTGRSNHVEGFRYEQAKSGELVFGRSNRSYLWLARKPHWYPVVADSDLGEWDRKKSFWKDTEPLQRVNGVIDIMRSHWVGEILLDGRVTARFVPRGEFLPDGDQNEPVNFFLGLSPEGLQAWEVRRGHLSDAISARNVFSELANVHRSEEPAPVTEPLPAEAQMARAAEIREDQKLAYCLSLLKAWQEADQTPRLSMLTERVRARYRDPGMEVEVLLEGSGKVSFTGDVNDPEIWLADGSERRPAEPQSARPFKAAGVVSRPGHKVAARVIQVYEAKRSVLLTYGGGQYAQLRYEDIDSPPGGVPDTGQLLWIEREMDQRGGCLARHAELLPLTATLSGDELVLEEELREQVERELRNELEARLVRGEGPPSEREITDLLEDRFKGALPLCERLGFHTSYALWQDMDWLCRKSEGNRAVLTLATKPVFGRTHPPRSRDTGTEPADGAGVPQFEEALAAAVDALQQRGNGEDPEFWAVLDALRSSLGRHFTTVVGPQGGRSLRTRVVAHPDWELVNRAPQPNLVRRTGGGLLAQALDLLEAKGRRPLLAELGKALREQLGDDYASTVGPALKAWVVRQPGWELRQSDSGNEVARTARRARGATGPVSGGRDRRRVAEDNLGADIASVVGSLRAQNKEPFLTAVGQELRRRWGPDIYRERTARRALRALVTDHGWHVEELRPGVLRLSEPDGSGDNRGGRR